MKKALLLIAILLALAGNAFSYNFGPINPVVGWDTITGSRPLPYIDGVLHLYSPSLYPYPGYLYDLSNESASQNANFLGGTGPTGLSVAHTYYIIRYGFDLVTKNQISLDTEIQQNHADTTATLERIESVRFTNLSTSLNNINQKLDGITGDAGMTYTGAVICGLLLSLIVAVTWKG